MSLSPFAISIFAGAFGAIIGSFLTVVAHRVPRGEPVVTGRSECTTCGHEIAAYDNVPVISYAVLRGRSRCCGETISARYPATEAVTAVLFAATALVFRNDPAELALGLIFVATLVVITLTDLERRIIPNRVLAVSAAIGIAVVAVTMTGETPERLIAALAAGGLLFVVALIHPRGMGMGDVKLVAVMGIYLGRSVAPALLIAFAAGAAVGIGIMLVQGSQARKSAIPFGPFLALGGVVGLLAGDQIVDWYLNSFSA